MLRKTLSILAVFGAFLALSVSPAEAQTSRVYFAGYIGLLSYPSQDFTESATPVSGDIELDNTNSFAGALGFRLSQQTRIEAEIGYAKADTDRINFSGGGTAALGGELTTWLTMANIFYDFDVDWPIKPFIGAGIGLGWHEGKLTDTSGTAMSASDDTVAFAWQVGGGLKYRVNPNMAFTSAYRYLDSTDLEFDSFEVDYGAHEFRLGLEYDLPVRGGSDE